jgi:hypothetical protein
MNSYQVTNCRLQGKRQHSCHEHVEHSWRHCRCDTALALALVQILAAVPLLVQGGGGRFQTRQDDGSDSDQHHGRGDNYGGDGGDQRGDSDGGDNDGLRTNDHQAIETLRVLVRYCR